MTTEEEFIEELKKYIHIQPATSCKGVAFSFENIVFFVKASDSDYIEVQPEDLRIFSERTTIPFEKNLPVNLHKGIWFFNPVPVFDANNYENNSIGNLNAEDAEKLKKTLRKAYENGKK